MRPAHSIFVPRDRGPIELLCGHELSHQEQKERAKELMHTGYSTGGVVEIWIAASAFGEPQFFRYKVPAVAPQPKAAKKLFGRKETETV